MRLGPQMIAPKLVVGVGSSAAPDAIARLLSAMPKESGIAVVVVQSDASAGLLGALRERSKLEIIEVGAEIVVEPNKAYFVSPHQICTIKDRRLALDGGDSRLPGLPIDRFLRSLALDLGASAAGILLSGYGIDGTSGLREIRAAGGLALALAPDTSGPSELAESAIEA